MLKSRLFCLPYAGASATVYMKWRNILDRTIELVPVEMAGRGRNFGTPFYQSLEEAVQVLYESIKDRLDLPYAIFGHSLGSVIGYELAHRIMDSNHRKPLHLFFSGRYPPYVEKKEGKIMHLLPETEFKAEIMKYGGTPVELIENPELFSIFNAILRADYRILEHYRYRPKSKKFNCDVTVLYGIQDHELAGAEIKEWVRCTDKNCNFYRFEGGHFYINEYAESVVEIINRTFSTIDN